MDGQPGVLSVFTGGTPGAGAEQILEIVAAAKAAQHGNFGDGVMDKVSKFKMPDKVNVLSPDGQDEVVDNYRNYIQQVVDGQITAEEAAQKTYDDAAALFTE